MEGRRSAHEPHGTLSNCAAPEAPVALPNVGQRYRPLRCQFLHSGSASTWPPSWCNAAASDPRCESIARTVTLIRSGGQTSSTCSSGTGTIVAKTMSSSTGTDKIKPSSHGTTSGSAPATSVTKPKPNRRNAERHRLVKLSRQQRCQDLEAGSTCAARQVPTPPEPSLAGAATPSEARPAATTTTPSSPPVPVGDDCDTQLFSSDDEESYDSMDDATVPSTLLSTVQTMPVLPPSSAEQAVTSMFADVSRASVAHAGHSPHLNVGEVLPSGVTTQLRELVVLATKVSKAIGIEMRADVYRLGVEMIAKIPHGRSVLERAEFYCNDIAGICFSRISPYEQATIVFWNNILFEPVTTEYVKREDSVMMQARLFVCTARVCPRHHEPCFAEFCSSFELTKEVDIATAGKLSHSTLNSTVHFNATDRRHLYREIKINTSQHGMLGFDL
ncbi:hypothetical protein PHYPSEUDO_004540 [Phytophthora pseudosyringae]|uniref:Uncharacterized protein n=1 Tax=Phytophthora pseudosyringae TaxID=221518 RepID=A0A8T1WIP5_9STRA|nr:hypothetical protein PHYPSEUDO_004540 [Phytophthora pseudosyringae]